MVNISVWAGDLLESELKNGFHVITIKIDKEDYVMLSHNDERFSDVDIKFHGKLRERYKFLEGIYHLSGLSSTGNSYRVKFYREKLDNNLPYENDSFEYFMQNNKGPFTITKECKEMLKNIKAPRFNGFIYNETSKNLPSKVFFNKKKKATTLQFGNKFHVVKAMKGDRFNKEQGFLWAYFEYMSGLSKTQAKKFIKEAIKEKIK